MIKIKLSRQQVSIALENYLRKNGYEPNGGVHIEKIETMDNHWYEAWAWAEKHPIIEIKEESHD